MSIPSVTITDQGVAVPSLDDTMTGLWSLLQTAFGQDLNTSLNTPQGQLVVSLSAMITDERNRWVEFLNQIDPRYAKGVYQDAIGYIYLLERKQATHSVAQVQISGLTGTIIPIGFTFADKNGNFWQTTSKLTIDNTGVILATVQCVETGAISATTNTITNITTALSGLDRVTNLAPAVVGREIESREDFESRRQDSVAMNAQLTDSAVRGAVANLADVLDVYVHSNHTSSSVNYGKSNYAIPRNSILLSVVGGNDQKIAWQLLAKAGSGCGFAGNTKITVQDTDSYPQSPPSYDVTFLRPTLTTVYWRISVQDKLAISFQDSKALKDAILLAMKTGKTRARIAQNIRAPLYIPALYSVLSNLDLIALEVSLDNKTWANSFELGVDQFPVSNADGITVA